MSTRTVVFIGDSITDCDRRTDPAGLGNGYVRILSQRPELATLAVRNRGISSERILDLRRRWETDVLAEDPCVVSILVGINETWRRFHSGPPTSAAAFEEDYRAVLDLSSTSGFVLIEPFLLPNSPEQESWRDDVDEKRAVVRSLATEYGAVLVPADVEFAALNDAHNLAPDGFHPSDSGHEVLAQLWLRHAAPLLQRVLRETDDSSRDEGDET